MSASTGVAPPRDVKFGVVRCFDTEYGFGFIKPDEGGVDLLFHAPHVAADHGTTIAGGQRVSYLPCGTADDPEAGFVHVVTTSARRDDESSR